jgi:DNA-binding HxlR family transcriptional regulator
MGLAMGESPQLVALFFKLLYFMDGRCQEFCGGQVKQTVFLTRLCHHRWSVPVLARVGERGGGRVAELVSALGGSPGGVRQAMDALIRLGLVTRNPGHGHPLRPEFVLRPEALRIAAAARAVVERIEQWSIQDIAFRKWTLPVVYALGEGARFSELRGRLPGITDRSLSEALQRMETARLARRVVHGGRPVGVEYVPTARAGKLRPLLGRLAEMV